MSVSRIFYYLLLAQFVTLVLLDETHQRYEKRSSGGRQSSGGQPVVTDKGKPNPGHGNNPKPGSQTPSKPNPAHPGVTGNPDPGIPIDTRGTEFMFCFTSNVGNARPSALMLLIGAGGPGNTMVSVSVPNFKFGREIEIHQGATANVNIPPAAAAFGTGMQNGTIWIRSNKPITVHGVNMQQKSNEGFLAIPVLGLGLEYFVASYEARGVDRSQLLITAVQDFSRIQIETIQRIFYNGKWFNIGDTILFTINRLQTVQIQAEGDLTGTRIRADRPISVMSGSTCSLVPQSVNRCDHLVENIPPVTTWGRRFSIVPFLNRTTGHVVRVIAARENTRFSTLGQVFLLARGGLFREFNQPITFPFSIVADKPLLVVQYAKGGARDRTGDPFMTIIPPIEQYVAGGVTFGSFDQSGTDRFRGFTSISVSSWDLFNVFMNHEPLLSHKYTTGPRQDWRRLVTFDADYQLPLKPGANTIANPAPRSRFAAIAYGFAQGTSYGFPVVYGLRRLMCTPRNTAEGAVETDCTGPIISGIVLSANHGTGLAIQPPKQPLGPNQPLAPGGHNKPGWGDFNPSKTGLAADGQGGGDAGVFFEWYTVPPWQEERWEEEAQEEELDCYSTGLVVLVVIAPAVVVFLVMLIIICALLFRRPEGNSKF